MRPSFSRDLRCSWAHALAAFLAVVLVPAIKLGVVILRSNKQSTAAEYEDPRGNVADAISRTIQTELSRPNEAWLAPQTVNSFAASKKLAFVLESVEHKFIILF